MFLAYLFFLHFIADFLLQSREVATNKSTSFYYLCIHLRDQGIIFLVGILLYCLPTYVGLLIYIYHNHPELLYATQVKLLLSIGLFTIFNTIIHGIIDWNIWRLYKRSVYLRNKNVDPVVLVKTWKYYEDHWFYATIGFDQLLHTLTIIVGYYIFFGSIL